jgi:hypothetical protein
VSREEKKQTDSLEAKNRAGERKKKNKKKSEENAERELFDKNPSRSYVLRDIWFDGLTSVIDNEEMPERSKRELMFLALSNAILDMVMDILPENLSKVLARNLDDYLAVMVINHEYDVDLLQSFQEEFEKEMGSDFEDDTQFMNALTEFESKWWNQPRRELNGKTPNELIEEVSERYGL